MCFHLNQTLIFAVEFLRKQFNIIIYEIKGEKNGKKRIKQQATYKNQKKDPVGFVQLSTFLRWRGIGEYKKKYQIYLSKLINLILIAIICFLNFE